MNTYRIVNICSTYQYESFCRLPNRYSKCIRVYVPFHAVHRQGSVLHGYCIYCAVIILLTQFTLHRTLHLIFSLYTSLCSLMFWSNTYMDSVTLLRYLNLVGYSGNFLYIIQELRNIKGQLLCIVNHEGLCPYLWKII